MTDTRKSDERLADAFRAIRDSSVELTDRERDRIWQAVSGVLPAEQRRALVDQIATSPAHAEAWRVAHAMWRASQGTATETTETSVPARARRWAPPWAAAAVLLIGTAVGLVTLRNQPTGDEFRSSAGYVIESRVPDADALPRDAFRLRWAAAPEGSRYRVRVTTEELVVLATAADLSTPEFHVAAPLLSTLPSGATVLWQVDAYLPDGERVTSRTFVTRVR